MKTCTDITEGMFEFGQQLQSQTSLLNLDIDSAESIEDILDYIDEGDEFYESNDWQEEIDALNLSVDDI